MYIHRVFRAAIVLFLVGATALAQLGCSTNCDPHIAPGNPGSCPDNTKEPGTEQGPCDDSFGSGSLCDDGLICYDGACIPCGSGNEICCDRNAGDQPCADGLACDKSTDPYDTCVADCGLLGLVCCGGDDCTVGLCSPISGLCEPGGQEFDCTGTESHIIWVLDGGGCTVAYKQFSADSAEEAQACADAFLAQNDPNGTHHLAPLDSNPTCDDVCQGWADGTGSDPVQLCHFEGLEACQDWQCGNCDWGPEDACD